MTVLHITLEEALAKPARLSDHLNYASYASHRDRLTDWPAARVQQMFVDLGIGNEFEVADWEVRYQRSLEEPAVSICADCGAGYHDHIAVEMCSCACHGQQGGEQ